MGGKKQMTQNLFVYAVFSMITGSITCAALMPLGKYIYRLTSAGFMKLLMGFCLMSFVIPPYMYYFVKENIASGKRGIPLIIIENETVEKIYVFLDKINFGTLMTALWISGAVVYLICLAVSYIDLIYNVRRKSVPAYGRCRDIYEKIENKADSSISLIISEAFSQPFTAGVKRKYIVFPAFLADELTDEEIQIILMHEITHAKRNDVFFKVFIEVLNSLNWFNPIFYMIKHRFELWTEISCDECLNDSFTSKIRKEYIELLLKIFSIRPYGKSIPASFLTSKKSINLRKRFEAIVENKGKGSMAAKVFISFMALSIFWGAGYMAKEADYEVYGLFGKNKKIADKDEIEIVDEFTIDEEIKDVKPIDDFERIYENEQADHEHIYVRELFSKHIDYWDGSCKITYFYADRCVVCKKVYLYDGFNDDYSYMTFVTCPHKGN